MPTFDTPNPSPSPSSSASATSDRRHRPYDTVVEVRPSDAAKNPTSPRPSRPASSHAGRPGLIKAPEGVAAVQPLPAAASRSTSRSPCRPARMPRRRGGRRAALRGRLGECHFKTSAGDIHLDQAGPVQAEDRRRRHHASTRRRPRRAHHGSGARPDRRPVDGPAVFKNSNGDTTIGEVTGDLGERANGRNRGRPAQARSSPRPRTATSASATSRAAPSRRDGASAASTSAIDEGVAAWLDLHTRTATSRTTSSRRTARSRRGDRRGTRPHLLRRHHGPPLPGEPQRNFTS